jgi:hypothetical protein
MFMSLSVCHHPQGQLLTTDVDSVTLTFYFYILPTFVCVNSLYQLFSPTPPPLRLAQLHNKGQDRHDQEVSRSHTMTHQSR